MTNEEDLLYIRTHLDLLQSEIKALGRHIMTIEADIHVVSNRMETFEPLWKRMARFELTHVELRNQVIANRAEQDKQASELRRLRSRFQDTAIDDQLLSDIAEEPE